MVNFTDFLWSYKISVSVQIYRDCNLQRKCGHLTEILPTFLKSVNGSMENCQTDLTYRSVFLKGHV